MRKKKLLFLTSCAALLFAGVFVFVCARGTKPFLDLRTEDVLSVSVLVCPPDTIRLFESDEEIREIVRALNAVTVYEKNDDWRSYCGQYVAYTLFMHSGETLEVAAYNPFLIINGQGYKTTYEPTEHLNNIANRAVRTTAQENDVFNDALPAALSDEAVNACHAYIAEKGYGDADQTGGNPPCRAVRIGEKYLPYVHIDNDDRKGFLDKNDYLMIFDFVNIVIDADNCAILGRIPLA